MVESPPSRQRRPPCKTNKGTSDEAADAATLTYLLTWYIAHEKHRELFAETSLGLSQVAL